MSVETLYVCLACGKYAPTREGLRDTLCLLNSVQCYKDALIIKDGKVHEIKDGGVLKQTKLKPHDEVVAEAKKGLSND